MTVLSDLKSMRNVRKFLPILIEIYNYESTKVSGSTGGARDFQIVFGLSRKCLML